MDHRAALGCPGVAQHLVKVSVGRDARHAVALQTYEVRPLLVSLKQKIAPADNATSKKDHVPNSGHFPSWPTR